MTIGTGPDTACEPPNLGFVIAMRARPVGAQSAEPPEWLIVARWEQGALLSVSWTGADASTAEAPLDLVPKRTVIGSLDRTNATGFSTLFHLLAILPPDVTVTGLFVPAAGTARLSGTNSKLRLRSWGHTVGEGVAQAWDFDAKRASWIGEFV